MGIFRKVGHVVGRVTGSETYQVYKGAASKAGEKVGPRVHGFVESQKMKAKDRKDQSIRESSIRRQAYQEARENEIRHQARRKARQDVRGGGNGGGSVSRVSNYLKSVDQGFGVLNGPDFGSLIDPFSSQSRRSQPRKQRHKGKKGKR